MGGRVAEALSCIVGINKEKGASCPFPLYDCLFYTIPCAIMALATFMKPAMFAPFT